MLLMLSMSLRGKNVRVLVSVTAVMHATVGGSLYDC